MAPELPSAALEKFLVGFEGASLPSELRDLLAQGLAGVAIFPRNFRTPDGLRSLCEEIRRAAERSALVAIDQEGGRKFSLPEPFTQWPSASELGALDDPALVERVARAMARELLAVGCNLDFAPMLDLHLQPMSPVTSGRSFGSAPERVARLGEAFLRGLAAEGVLGCAKHFPGHGDTHVDPHEDLPVFYGSMSRLEKTELVPFVRAIAASVPIIMTAHILLPLIDTDHPASLSRTAIHRLLRERLHYEGAILADDLGMGAIRKRHLPAKAAIETFRAGSDLALLCHEWSLVRPTIEAVVRALEKDELDRAELEQSHARIEHLRTLANDAPSAPPLDIVGCAEHRDLAREIRDRAHDKLS
jgi:beta-N-acetylhexosaminidase